jgi:predicted PurR-regulated permease PerM
MNRRTQPAVSNADAVPWSAFSRSLAVVVVVIGVFAFLGFLFQAAQTLLLGFLIAFLIYRPTRSLARRVQFRAASGIFHLLLLVLLLAFVVWGLRLLAEQAGTFESDLAQGASGSALASLVSPLQATGIGGNVATAIRGLISSVAGLVGVAFIAIIFSFWLTSDMFGARGGLGGWLIGDGRRQVGLLLHRLDQIWIGYLTAEIIFGLVMFGASLVEYWLLGVPYFVLMALLTGILTLIPSIGGLIASLVVAVPCLVFGSTRFTTMDPVVFTLLVTVINVITTQVSYNLIAVPIIGRYVRLPASLVLIAVLIGVTTGNFLLAFLIVPMLASIRIGVGYLLSKSRGIDPYPGEAAVEALEEGLFGQLAASPAAPASPPAPPRSSAAPKTSRKAEPLDER